MTEQLSQRIEDPEKARVMAEAEDPHREAASQSSELACLSHEEDDYELAHHHGLDADLFEDLAEKAGKEAGRQYDAEKSATS